MRQILFKYLSIKSWILQSSLISIFNISDYKRLNLFNLNKLILFDSKQIHFMCVSITKKEIPPLKRKNFKAKF